MADRLTISVKARQLRGITYLPHGQQFSGWIPQGKYDVGETFSVWISTLGINELHEVIELIAVGAGNHGKWLVGPKALENEGLLIQI